MAKPDAREIGFGCSLITAHDIRAALVMQADAYGERYRPGIEYAAKIVSDLTDGIAAEMAARYGREAVERVCEVWAS